MTEVRHPFQDFRRVPVLVESGESRVRQEFLDSVDVNNIMAKYSETGVVRQRTGAFFADVSSMTDLKTAMDKVQDLPKLLKKLPKEARDLFDSDPGEFATKMARAETREEFVELGILPGPDEVPAGEPAVAGGDPAAAPETASAPDPAGGVSQDS